MIARNPSRHTALALALARTLARCCAAALPGQVTAAFLHGSLTHGDFAPGHSDVDLLVVVERPLTDGELGAFTSVALSLGGNVPARVDLRVVTRAVAAAPTPAPPLEAYAALEPGRPPHVETRVAAEPDLTVEFSVVRAHGRSLLGPNPASLVGAVPDEWVDEIGAKQVAAWKCLTHDAAHDVLMILTACRVWRFKAERVHCGKSDAARWALARDPALSAVELALRKRAGASTAAIPPAGIARVLNRVLDEVSR